MMKKGIAILLAMLLVCGMLFAGGAGEISSTSTSSEVKKGGVFRIAITGDASTMSLYELRGTSDCLYLDSIFESLMVNDETGTPTPFLAESVVGDPEALTYTIKLKEGIKFHDGSELTAEVCKWNLEMYKEYGVLSSSFMSKIDNIVATDKYTVVINMSSWDPFLPNNMARSNGCGYMMSKQAFDTYGMEYIKTHPVTTGPFVFDHWERDTKVVLTKNADYWQGEPNLDGVEIVVYSTLLVAEAALKTGEVQAIFGADTEMCDYLKSEGYCVSSTAVPSTCYNICMDCTDETDPLSNLKCRQAVAYAIDSATIADVVFSEYGILSNQYSWPGERCYNESVNYDYNPEKAKALLAEAGYPNGFSTVIHSVSSSVYNQITQIVQEQLAQVGIKVEIDNTDIAGYLANINGWGQGMLIHPMGLANGVPAQIAANYVQGLKAGIGVTTFIHNDEMNSLIQKGMTQSGDELTETFKTVQGIIFGDLCMMKVIACTTATNVYSPKLMDSGFGEVSASRCSTYWKTWIAE